MEKLFGIDLKKEGKKNNGLDEFGDEYIADSIVGPEGVPENMRAAGGPTGPGGPFGNDGPQVQLTAESIDEYADCVIARCKKYQSLGFNAALLDIKRFILEFYDPSRNHRTDEYGGSHENRCRFIHQFLGRLRKAVGNDYLLVMNGPHGTGGLSDEDFADLIKQIEPYCDILQLRGYGDEVGVREDFEVAEAVEVAARLKQNGVKIVIAANTPYMDLDTLDGLIADGKVDMISSNHLFMCNDRLGEILAHGNGDDLRPCLMCHVCRGMSFTGNWTSACTVNPRMGVEYRIDKMAVPVESSKRIAIIGGGPGAMSCAARLKDRGHQPEIFERTDALGGQLKTSRFCDFKWRMERYLNYLEHQVDKRKIPVHLNATVTPDEIMAGGYDVVIAATGAEPQLPDIPGAEHADKWNVVNIYGNEDSLGRRVTVVGGASSAAEAAIHLARSGHEVTILSRKNIIAYDLDPIRERGFYNEYAHKTGVQVVKNATTTAVEAGLIHYQDKDGNARTLEFDDIILTGGMRPNSESATAYSRCAEEFYMIGDCRQPQNLRLALRDAYAVAMQIK